MKNKVPRFVARVYCKGCEHSQPEAEQKDCTYGCIGCGACVESCKLHAITLGENGAAVVDDKKCVGCGLCIKACPQDIIQKVASDHGFQPLCSNKDAAADAKKACDNSCIGCRICEKNCPMGAITIEENHAVIDEELCTDCGFCLVKCPRGVIEDVRGLICKNR